MKDTASKMIAALFAEQRILTVGELTEQIKDTLESEFFALQVQGEVSNYKRHQSGHWYFTLKDSEAQLRGVFFRQWNRLMRFEPENGLEVRVRGRLSVYEPRGEYQIVVETMEPVGVGALQLAFEQQVKKLAAEGLFDEARKRPLPPFPRRIGIVTSPVGAAVRDMLQILERRNRGVDVLIAPVRVQGTGAAREIADAIRLLNQHPKKTGKPVDVIIIGRGGGSMEDLWAFNEEQVVRAIYESEIPIVSAVGHETDFTIADFVADFRAPTPSAAAEIVTRQADELMMRVEELSSRLEKGMNYYLLRRRSELRDLVVSPGFTRTANVISGFSGKCRELESRAVTALKENLRRARFRLDGAGHRLTATDFRAPLAVKAARLENLERRTHQAIRRTLEQRQHRLALVGGKLSLLSPLSVLGRGYALAKDEAGRLIPRAADLMQEQTFRLLFEDGEIGCRVIEPTHKTYGKT
ncbi:MAG TPA: exodeoxyribonuclease VII large subunit [Blastocatellia bacterium]|nr:exodeoxyribonuclease VII large subunit [Blastocatellia bacterium]HMV83449.1 exodeoxyribonuclease VII large subunit [Blastocatellia bacterium]HMZ16705.1 exodeoxyribonuclease VII large subunit [Blastocatellia bacterium]HNG28076.1 exodeoxyribonuclease VII large subunit [Blastocatellia bacterium]